MVILVIGDGATVVVLKQPKPVRKARIVETQAVELPAKAEAPVVGRSAS